MNFDKMMAEKEEAFSNISELIKEKAAEYEREIAELEGERLRIQGEYRVLAQLKAEAEQKEKEENAAEIAE